MLKTTNKKKVSSNGPPADSFRNRIKGLIEVKASELVEHPLNFRMHPDRQKSALEAILKDVGIANACIVFQRKDGRYQLIDGHLRSKTIGDKKPIPCLLLDVDDAEANRLLATLDPLAAWAERD